MVSAITDIFKGGRICSTSYRQVKINAAIGFPAAFHPIIELHAKLIPKRGEGSPATDGKQCSKVSLHAMGMRLINAISQTIGKLLKCRHIVPGTERIFLYAHRMDDVVDPFLNDDGVRTGHWEFVREADACL